MAPERFLGRAITHRVDVYALTCVLFECLTGGPPYVGEAPALIHGHLSMPVPALAAHRPELPAALEEVVARGMAKDPEERFATAGALAAAARATLVPVPVPLAEKEPVPVLIRTVPATEPTRRYSGLRPGPPAADGPTVIAPRPDRPASPVAVPSSRGRRRVAWLVAVAALVVVALGTTFLAAALPSITPPVLAPIVEHVLTGHTDAVIAVATAEVDGRPVAVSGGGNNDPTVRVWDLNTGRPIGQPLTGHTTYVNAVATTQLGGQPIAVSASNDNTLRVWDLNTRTSS